MVQGREFGFWPFRCRDGSRSTERIWKRCYKTSRGGSVSQSTGTSFPSHSMLQPCLCAISLHHRSVSWGHSVRESTIRAQQVLMATRIFVEYAYISSIVENNTQILTNNVHGFVSVSTMFWISIDFPEYIDQGTHYCTNFQQSQYTIIVYVYI